MYPPIHRFDRLLVELEAARHADDELHSANASLADRAASHDTLSHLRAEIAKARVAYERDAIIRRGVRPAPTNV